MAGKSCDDRPRLLDWACVAGLGLVVVLFGLLTVARAAWMQARHTDFSVYARAAWAARTGHDIYQVTDEDGLHYCYPPPFAIVMAPFAEPAIADDGRYLRFDVSVAIWYTLSVGFAFWASHLIASALEAHDAPTPTGTRTWWKRRLWPFLITVPGIGATLSHGQVNTLLLLFIAGFIAALSRGRARRAGGWLAAAVALKVIPAFLVLGPVLRRDRRFVVGLAAGLVVILGVLPAIAMGPAASLRAHRGFVEAMISPAVAGADNAERAREMFHVLKTDNQSIMAVIHAWQWAGHADAPAEPGRAVRAIHWTLALMLTTATLAAGWRRPLTGHAGVLLLGSLMVVLLFISPMCHLHYYCLTMPLVAGLLHVRPISRTTLAAMTLHVVGVSFPLIFGHLRNFGFAPLGALPLWFLAIDHLRTTTVVVAPSLRRAA